MASRPIEEQALREFLDSASSTPSALLVDGEAGIGKTTLWLAGLEQARGRGFRVLSARVANAQSVLAYASLADLLEGTSAFTWADLPDPQRIAVDRVLLREQAAVTDRRALAAAFLSVIERLSDHGPFLPAIDDLQWLDPSSVHVIAFAARRLSGPVGFLGTVRTEPDSDGATSWLQLPRPDAIHRIAVHPLSSRALHTVVRDELGHPVPRAAMTRIQQISAETRSMPSNWPAPSLRASMRYCLAHWLSWSGPGSAALIPRPMTCCLPPPAWPRRPSSWSAKPPPPTMTG